MNTYNQLVVDQYCAEVHYTPSQKRNLIERLRAKYGDQLDTVDLFTIRANEIEVKATLTPIVEV